MPTLPVPIPFPQPVPWPTPSPGVGTPVPSPGSVAPGIVVPMPTAGTGGNGITDPFANLFKFPLDWRLLGALIFIALTVAYMEDQYPEYAWLYVGVLLLGFTVPQLDKGHFWPQFLKLIGR